MDISSRYLETVRRDMGKPWSASNSARTRSLYGLAVFSCLMMADRAFLTSRAVAGSGGVPGVAVVFEVAAVLVVICLPGVAFLPGAAAGKK